MAQYGDACTVPDIVPVCPPRRRLRSSSATEDWCHTDSGDNNNGSRKRKVVLPPSLHDNSDKKRGKQPVSEGDIPPRCFDSGTQACPAPTSGAPANLTALHDCDGNFEMSWQGDMWMLEPMLEYQRPTPVTKPIPVRFPATLLSREVGTEATADGVQWMLGLVIHSYVQSDRFELMYVVLLDDGREVHMPCGEVDRIAIVKHSQSSQQRITETEDSDFRFEGGHPSSQERYADSHTSLSSFYSTLLRSSDVAVCSAEKDYEATSSHQCTVLGCSSTIGCPHGIHTATVATQSTPPPETYARLFEDVLHDCMTPSSAVQETLHNRAAIATCSTVLEKRPVTLPGRSRCSHPALASEEGRALVQRCSWTDMSVRHKTQGPVPMPMSPPQACRQTLTPAFKSISGGSGGEANSSRRHTAPTAPSLSARPTASAGRNEEVSRGTSTTGVPVAAAPARPARVGRTGRMSAAAERRAFLQAFSNETWSMERSDFAVPAPAFVGPAPGPSFPMHRMLTKTALFSRFWSEQTLHRICVDTNRYASEMHPVRRVPLGGPNWWRLDKAELKAFMAVNLLMGIKHLPNHRSYWNRSNQFLYCPSISSIMTSKRYEDITRCLHIADDNLPPLPGVDVEFDRLRKMRWLIRELQEKFKSNWHLHQEVTVDETIIPYKGTYCPVRQYLPRKPTKWGVKVWCLADARDKYLYDFQIYTGSISRESLAGGSSADAKTPHQVVMHLMEGLHGLAHVVCTDNYFTSVKLLLELLSRGTFGVGTIRCNRLGLPTSLLDLKNLSKEPQGSLLWRMHRPAEIAAVVFVDRKAVLMLSTIYPPIPAPGQSWPTVPRRIHGVVSDLDTSPVYKAYTEFMRGVDVADHLRGNYSCQTRSHKWWHKIFFYLLDTSVVNCYILNKIALEQFGKDPVMHMNFQLQLADELSRPWSMQRGAVSQFRLSLPGVHGLVRSGRRRKCRFCRGPMRTNLLCPQCGGVFLHSGECFQRSHYVLRR